MESVYPHSIFILRRNPQGLEISLKASKPKREIVLDQTQQFGTNRVDKILIRACLLNMDLSQT